MRVTFDGQVGDDAEIGKFPAKLFSTIKTLNPRVGKIPGYSLVATWAVAGGIFFFAVRLNRNQWKIQHSPASPTLTLK